MVSFLRSNKAVTAALLASTLAKTDAYGRLYYRNRPSTALASRMLPALGGPSLLFQDTRRVMRDMDEMFDSILGDFDDMFYNPRLPLPRVSGPSPYLLRWGAPESNARTLIAVRPRNAHWIAHDDRQLNIAMDVRGAEASGINLRLYEDGRVLRISGETKREEGGISVHSRFDRAFALNRDIDTSKISAHIDDGVLTIIAPKYGEGQVKENVRRIDIVENKKVESDEAASDEAVSTQTPQKEEESSEMEQEDHGNMIDLDLKQD
jgi:HSP20 family protein